VRDLLVGLPGGQESEDFLLAGRQSVLQRLTSLRRAVVLVVLFLFRQLPEESGGQFLVEGRLTVQGSTDRVDQAVRGGVLEYVAGGAGIQRFEEVVGFSCMVTMRTLMPGCSRLIWRVAVIPSISGIRTSISTRSGSRRRHISMASWPVDASPTTSIPGSLPSRLRNPLLKRW